MHHRQTTFLKNLLFASALIAIYALTPRTVSAEACRWVTFNMNSNGLCQDSENAADAKCAHLEKPLAPPSTRGYIGCCCYTAAPKYKPAEPIQPQLSTPLPKLNLTVITEQGGGFTIPWIGEYVSSLYDYGISIAGLLASVMLMAGGLMWLIAGGSEERIGRAKGIITGSFIGLLVLLCSHLILLQINPDLTAFKPISLDVFKKKMLEKRLLTLKASGAASAYASAPCITDADLEEGVEIYSTGYYKPAYENTDEFFCKVGLNCWCPNGNQKDYSIKCNHKYGACKRFGPNTPYCTNGAGAIPLAVGKTVAAPAPSGNCAHFEFGEQICYAGQTFTVNDRGAAITGRRIDIWSGTDYNYAIKNTGVATLKKGPCQ